ncbi:nicotinate-nucleotide adenylyltransferase [Hymenobacter sp. BT186]|uniref:Probable nicotinate-nucleotide adenylyltransferase n=1 Tax=Hymenobacter telluris TaxID=2816474 RepID=A0A939J9J7_9BACT|nr:nicotinate (nicotinamide) nucleotide adenylyltransferase [Hymenobacter telluris]MBO0357131.1 nicotinate-nucleotide adenylyltransferase [Hymenobacter telluris]MBW3373158.1 nicotinate-nucleotide adenylyltransferase [Hymenobacter norwichensis]
MSSSEQKRVGLLFGSFNPIHIGHLILAQHMVTHTDLAEVWFVVSPQSPYKVGQQLLPEQDRLALVEAAIADNPQLRTSSVEFQLPRPNYTVATLDELGRQYPQYQFVLLMGGDNLAGLAGWKDTARIQQEFDMYVYPRPGYEMPVEAANNPRLRIVEAPPLDISATFIRESLHAGKSIRYLVPEAVEQQIEANRYWASQ